MNSQPQFVDWLRELVSYLRAGGEFTDEIAVTLEDRQDRLAALYEKYESAAPSDNSATLRELMMEALQLIHNGLDEILDYGDEPEEGLLDSGLAAAEEGNDVLESLRYVLEQDTGWVSSAALG